MAWFKRDGGESLTPEEEAKVNAKFESFKQKQYSESDMNKVFDNEDKIMGKMNDKYLSGFIDAVKDFDLMLKDFFTGQYKEVPVGTIVAIVGTLLYVFSPFDIIPDFIPGFGYLDDAGVVAACLNFVQVDLDKYRAWKAGKE